MAELSRVATYRILLGSRLRAQLSYRASFVADLIGAFLIGITELTEIYVILHNVPVLGGLTLVQAAFVFALANVGFAIGDMVFGQLDTIPTLLRMGRLEALLVRPMPLMAQLVTTDLQLRRLGRASAGVLILCVIGGQLDIDWSPGKVWLVIITPLVGAAICGAWFALAGGIQFFLIEGGEFTNSFVYGGSYAAQIPGGVLVAPLRVFFTFVIPATAVAYLPALVILDRPGPALLPSWLGWLGPLFAVWAWLLATWAWRSGVRRFTGAGG